MDLRTVSNNILPTIIKELRSKFGEVSDVNKIPKHVISKYIHNTREYSLPKLVDDAAGFMALCGKNTKSTGNGKDRVSSRRTVDPGLQAQGRGIAFHLNSSEHSPESRVGLKLRVSGTRKNPLRELMPEFRAIIKEAFAIENEAILVDILRNNRFVLYLAQYSMIIEVGDDIQLKDYVDKITAFRTYTKNNNGYTYVDDEKDPIYFEVPNKYFIAYLAASYAIHAKQLTRFRGYLNSSTLDYMTREVILSLPTINNMLKTRVVFNKTPLPEIKRTILSYHGGPTDTLVKLPDNKILVIITPLNRYGLTSTFNVLKPALTHICSDDHVKRFINNYMCYINALTSRSNKPANNDNNISDCLLNGIQVYYGGQTYFDIKLESAKKDLIHNLDTYTFNREDISFHQQGKTIVNTSIYESIKNDNIPEIIVVDCCRMVDSDTRSNLAVELQYRYSKIHDIITDAVSQCSSTDLSKARINLINTQNSDAVCARSNYVKYFTQEVINKSHNNTKYKNLLLNSNLTPIREKHSLKLGQMMDYIIKKPIDKTTDDYITTLVDTDWRHLLSGLGYIRIDITAKLTSIYLHIIKTKNANYNNLFILISMLISLLKNDVNSSKIDNIYEFICAPGIVSADLSANLPKIKTEMSYEEKTNICVSITNICMTILNMEKLAQNEENVQHILKLLLPYSYQLLDLNYVQVEFLFRMYVNEQMINEQVLIITVMHSRKIVNWVIEIFNDYIGYENLDYLDSVKLAHNLDKLFNFLKCLMDKYNSNTMNLRSMINNVSDTQLPAHELHCMYSLYATYINAVIDICNYKYNDEINIEGELHKIQQLIMYILYVYDNDNYIRKLSQDTIMHNIYSILVYMFSIPDFLNNLESEIPSIDKIREDTNNAIGMLTRLFIKQVPINTIKTIYQIYTTYGDYIITLKLKGFNPPITNKYKGLFKLMQKESEFIEFVHIFFPDWHNAHDTYPSKGLPPPPPPLPPIPPPRTPPIPPPRELN